LLALLAATPPTRWTLDAGSLNFPVIVDLLDKYKVTWKCYNLGLGLGGISWLEHFNALNFFQNWQNDDHLQFSEDDYHNALSVGTLPQVSFLIIEELISEYLPLNIQDGQKKMAEIGRLRPGLSRANAGRLALC
jgi:Phosphoesterase family